MKFIVLIWMMLSSLYGAEGTKKVVYDVTTGSFEKFTQVIASGIVFQKNHYESKMEDLQAIVVIHGEAYRYFLKSLNNTPYTNDKVLDKNHSELIKRLESLNKYYGVKFEICGIGMRKRQIKEDQVLPFVEIIPSSTTGLIDAQDTGYAYVPVN